jgi:cation:H+ antiporter
VEGQGEPGSLVGARFPMPTALALLLFVASLTVTLAAARLFARRLDRLGVRFGFPETLVGLLTAVAADGPEISSALFALFKGAHDVSVGVLVGSNAFNLAAMIGLSGLLAGRVRLRRETLLLESTVGAAITLIAAAVLVRWLAPAVGAVVGGCVVAAYLLLVLGGSRILTPKRRSAPLLRYVARAVTQRPRQERAPAASSDPTHHLLGLIIVDVALIIAGSAGMVQAALTLGGRWGISKAVLGVVILAPLTSVPNAVTGVRLGLANRGAALVGETFNSNAINLGAGVIVPALFVTLGAVSATGKLQLAWLIAMTFVTVGMLGRKGVHRWEGALIVALYLGFLLTQLASA